MKKLITLILLCLSFVTSKAQSQIMEIQWYHNGVTYSGLMLLYPNNSGYFRVKYIANYQLIWCDQNATIASTTDMYGNITTYLNCYNPKCVLQYAADNFVIYPNGQMYTQDWAGNWSTLVQWVLIDPQYWGMKKNEYGFR